MKLAIVGKGGVGKTTLAAALAQHFARFSPPVIAIDADPDGNLGSALGVPGHQLPEPIAGMRDLILERTGAKDQPGGFYSLNPKVDDLPDRFSVEVGGVRLLVLGTVEWGGKGCMCPEGAVLKALLQHLLLRVPEHVILDMEAGLEHLGRASARGVDAMISVVEPGMRSVQTAARVRALASEIGIRRTFVVANKIRDAHEREVLQQALGDQPIIGTIPYCDRLVRADLDGMPVLLEDDVLASAVRLIGDFLAKQLDSKGEGHD